MNGPLTDVINCDKFCDNLFKGFNFTGGQNSNFSHRNLTSTLSVILAASEGSTVSSLICDRWLTRKLATFSYIDYKSQHLGCPLVCDTSKHLTALYTADTKLDQQVMATPYSTAPMLGGGHCPLNQSWGVMCPCCPRFPHLWV